MIFFLAAWLAVLTIGCIVSDYLIPFAASILLRILERREYRKQIYRQNWTAYRT